MIVLLHPTISWQGWQEVKQSQVFQRLSPGERIRLVNQLPQALWTWEMSDSSEIDALLETLGLERHDSE
jgi:hypothetical protein